ncbi:SGNH/GDSL hydrolase family protein [Tundrisphaera lichenicola]|uniref:SGNH/GDSL hydrolase family protein n=1 Tax=Tundrisphaera lichenicola TaxID=2029860 RepID=UPI003EB8B749
MIRISCLAALLALGIGGNAPAFADEQSPLEGVHRVVFLGDSITYSGQFVEDVEAYLRLKDPGLDCEFLDIGLPSETVSGLSEPGHAGGAFPRPSLGERVDRVLAATRPDLVVVCYGMNDGIYYPYGDERFAKYREGIESVRAKAQAAGARVLHLTPPVFDAVPVKASTLPAGLSEYRQPYTGYDEVLNLYGAWLLAQRGNGWDVVDLHGPIEQYLAHQRVHNPDFRLAGDGVHIDATGQWLIARELLKHWGVPAGEVMGESDPEKVLGALPNGLEVLKLVQSKQRMLKDSWLTETRHKRPGMKKGLPMAEAQAKAGEIDGEIRKLLKP